MLVLQFIIYFFYNLKLHIRLYVSYPHHHALREGERASFVRDNTRRATTASGRQHAHTKQSNGSTIVLSLIAHGCVLCRAVSFPGYTRETGFRIILPRSCTVLKTLLFQESHRSERASSVSVKKVVHNR